MSPDTSVEVRSAADCLQIDAHRRHERPKQLQRHVVLVAAAKRKTRRLAGGIEARRRHERSVVVPTSERDLHGRLSRSRRGHCRGRGRYGTSQATCPGEHAGAACEPTIPISRPFMPPAALTLCAARFWQGWLPALLNETVVPLTGLGAPLPSFPFVDLDHVLPSEGLMHQFVMVLVARFHMSVAEIVMAYTLVSPHTIEPHHHSQPTRPSPKHQPPRNDQVEQIMLRNSPRGFSRFFSNISA